MAKSINQVVLEGNIVGELELRFTAGGVAVSNITIAVNHSKKVDNEWVDEANFVDVTLFGQIAEQAVETFNKGDRALVTGRLVQRQWETDSGDKRSKIEVIAELVAPSLRYATAAITRIKREDG